MFARIVLNTRGQRWSFVVVFRQGDTRRLDHKADGEFNERPSNGDGICSSHRETYHFVLAMAIDKLGFPVIPWKGGRRVHQQFPPNAGRRIRNVHKERIEKELDMRKIVIVPVPGAQRGTTDITPGGALRYQRVRWPLSCGESVPILHRRGRRVTPPTPQSA